MSNYIVIDYKAVAKMLEGRVAELERELNLQARGDVSPIVSNLRDALSRIGALESAIRIADTHFGYPERGPAVDYSCMCSYCQYARVRSRL